jgi:lantibiotic modifying enzyme
MISSEAMARLAARASTLDERLAPGFVCTEVDPHPRIEARLLRWAELGAKGDRDRLRQSLEWRGIDLDRMVPALGNVSLSPESTPPTWVRNFAGLVDAALIEHRRSELDSPENHRTAVMAGFARAAKAKLCQTLPSEVRVTGSALAALERSLLLRLTRLAGPVLDREYDLYARGDSRAGGPPNTRARRFADRVLQSPFPPLFTEFPVLARLTTLVCDNWLSAFLELFQRLAADHECISEQFHQGRDPGPLMDIQVGDADLHDGHREVLILVFADGFRVVYKPRSLVLDQAFSGLLQWLNLRGLSPAMRSPRVLCREQYGWAEFIPHCLAADSNELASFYQRMGVLACIAYLMCATDLHNGNLIAHGDSPILIDLETLLHAHPRGHVLPALNNAPKSGYQGFAPSVLESVLLPLLHRAPTGVFVDLSALAAEGVKQAGWLPAEQSQLRQTLRDYSGAIEEGFASAYAFIQHHRDGLLAPGGPLTAFAGCPIRVVLRDTAIYFHLLRQSIEPAVMRDAADREILLERLHHSIATAEAPPSFVHMVTREKAALWNLDVPRFLVMTDATALRDAAGEVAPNVMRRTPLEEMRIRVEDMSESDLRVQRENIRCSLSTYFSRGAARRGCGGTPESTREAPAASELIAAAERIGAELREEVSTHAGQPPSWRGAVFLNPASGFTVGEAGGSFADGGMGIAFFFAALFRVTEKTEWRETATQLSLAYLKRTADLVTYHGHIAGGLTAGFGGLLYAAAHIAALTESEEISRNALAAARNFAERSVAEERDMSLGDGLAGTLLGIAAIQKLAGDASLEQVIQQGADRLGASKPLVGAGILNGRAGVGLAAKAIEIRCQSKVPEIDSHTDTLDWAEGSLGLAVARLKFDPGAADALEFFERLGAHDEACDDSFALGAAGEADSLAWAADLTGRTTFRNLALRRMAAATERAYRGRSILLGGELGENLRMPGLLHGSAGIGVVLLRLAAPGILPALAALELP